MSRTSPRLLLIAKAVAVPGGGILSNGALGAINTGGASVTPNSALIGSSDGYASVGESSTLVVEESFSASFLG